MRCEWIVVAVFRSLVHAGSASARAFEHFSQAVAPVVATALWQGVALAAGLAICLKLAPRISASHRFLVWSSGLLALIALPFVPLVSSSTLSAHASGISSSLAARSTGALLQIDLRWSLLLAALWITGSLVRAVDLALHSFRLRRLWRTAVPIDSLQHTASGAAWLRRPLEICTTQELDRPSVIGFLAPRILIPDWLLARLTPGELDQIILHETEHLRRHDDWTNLFQKLCLVAFPLNPALWWIERQLAKEREMACDEGVVRVTCAPRAYAACLTSLAERGLERSMEALSLGAWQRRPELIHRVHSILRRKREMHPLASRALVAAMGCSLLIVSVEFARCPQFVAFVPAQRPEPAPAYATAGRHAEPAGLTDTAFAPAAHAPKGARAFYALEAKAVVPAPPPSNAHERRFDSHSNEPRALEASTILPASPTLRQDLSRELPPQAVTNNDEQWIVFTAWEQVETPVSQSVADYDTGAAAERPMTNLKTQPPAKPAKVTGLIFRILPENPTQPHAVSLGNGWFVIQL